MRLIEGRFGMFVAKKAVKLSITLSRIISLRIRASVSAMEHPRMLMK